LTTLSVKAEVENTGQREINVPQSEEGNIFPLFITKKGEYMVGEKSCLVN
jgi:hypothetical protein